VSLVKKRIALILFLLSVACLAGRQAAWGFTADEYFEFGSTKYLQGDNAGALREIKKSLEIDPKNQAAQELKSLIEQEISNQPAVPEAAPVPAQKEAPAAKPAPPQVIKERVIEKIIEKQSAPVIIEREVQKIDDVIYTAVVFAVFFSLLFMVLLFKLWQFFLDKTSIVCAECKARNIKDAEFCKKCGTRLKAADLTPEQKLWLEKFGWKSNPFTLNVMPNTYAGHQVEIALIMEKLNTLSGHILIVGGMGTGKTTLLLWLEKHLKDRFDTIYLLRPPERPEEVIDLISATIAGRANHTRKYSIYEFREICRKHKRNILLLIDEAHELNEKLEQFLRTLGDLHNVYLVMAGLPQTRELLKKDLPALFDRVVESMLLGALSLEETKELIQKRISNAGGQGMGPFTAQAVEKIYELGYGIPRGVLKVCDWVVAKSVRENKTVIDASDVAVYNEEMKHVKPEAEKDAKVNPAG